MPKVCPHCRTEYGPDQVVCPNDGALLSDSAATADPLIGQLLADRYRVIRTLGEGGMGRVYLAEHVRMGRLSAVKVMSPALAPTPDAISRFNREAANASRINHPNVAAIYDFGETADGVLYLAMEYVDGETLAALTRRMGALPLTQVGALVRQIADALQAAHSLGIVHRDLKPDNILITKDGDGNDSVKVVDFGIAKTVQGGGQTVTTVGMSIGTPEFMSPEQLAGETLDARTDIYSLGLVTFTMLTGELAYPSHSSKQSLVQRLTTRPRPLTEARPSVAWPPRLQSALDKALSPEPHDRFEKATEFAREVGAATDAVHAITQERTRAMTPLAVRTIEPLPVVEKAAAHRGNKRTLLYAAGAVAIVAVAAMAIQGSRSKVQSSAQPIHEQPSTADSVTMQVASETTSSSPAARLAAPPSTPVGQRAVGGDSAPALTKSRRASNANPPVRPAPSPVAATTARVDSQPLAPTVNAPVGPSTGRHFWLRANGDSAAEALPAVSALATEAREVLGHLNKARRLIRNKQPAKAGAELRTAGEELTVFAAAHPGTRETLMLRQQFMGTVRDALAECTIARDSSNNSARVASMCNGLEKAVAAHSSPTQGGPVPLGNGRRRNRPPGGANRGVPE